MPVSKEFTESVIGKLSAARPVTFKKMFGGTGYYCGDVFFAIGDDDRLYFKVDDISRPRYMDRGMEMWICAGQEMPSYRELPDDILNDPVALGDWIDEAVATAKRLKSKKK